MKRTPYALTYAPNFKWAPLDVEGADGKAWIKILGKDQDSGATAALVKYDAGFVSKGGTSEVFSDSIVVDGRLTLDGEACNRLSYWYRPTGTNYGVIKAEEDVTRFVITGGRGEEGSTEGVHLDSVEANEGWEVSERSSAWSEKTLRVDERANCLITYQSANMFTMFLTGQKWVHPDVEEAYCIDGAGWDYVGEVDTFVKLLPGTYIYRPPNETFHGTATTFEVPRRIFVKYYNADHSCKFARSIQTDIVPATISE
ncbi:MAG TPA: DUF4437 domain-containing protein [Mycobacteriales bacterium]|nr:DUF4437 domain-containing protein [Mycobacteriales bacterium]